MPFPAALRGKDEAAAAEETPAEETPAEEAPTEETAAAQAVGEPVQEQSTESKEGADEADTSADDEQKKDG